MAKTKSDFDIVTQGFIRYLEKTGQLGKLPQLAKEQIKASKSYFDPNLAVVQTVVKLNPKEISQLQAKLAALFNRPIKVKNQVNKNILGGMLIRVGDEIIDLSLQSRLTRIKQQLYA